MASIYESLKDLLSPEMTTKIAQALNEKEANISKAGSQIIAGLLGVIAKRGHTTHLKQIFQEAGNINLLSDIGMFDEHLTHPEQEIGDNFLEHVLGDKAEAFTTAISKTSGVPHTVVNKLTSVIAPSFPAFFGNKLVNEGIGFENMINEIKAQEKSFSAKIPNDLIKTFGLGTLLNQATTTSTASTKTSVPEFKPAKKSKNSWISWLFALIALLLIFFWWKSCNSKPDNITDSESMYMVDSVVVMEETPPTTQVALPNGEKLEGYKDGTEEQLVKFLSGGGYEKATAKDLENKWFEFDNIDFEFGSTTKLKEGSKVQLDNIIAILNAHKDVKVMIAAFSDKRGTETANMKVSKERAQRIEKMLEEGGVGAQVVKAEGYGDTQAKYSADAPESDRQKDRDIALRFVK